ncbi:DUF1801 domain-containing protein [bacterium SCSIO 12741]|nr:DUF1801 domain-containing protein [bacterium SCSIO 12741]
MSEIEDWIYGYDGNQREIMLFFHHMLTKDFNLIEKMKFKLPFYYGKSWICYLSPTSNDSVELAFTRGNELSNHQQILESKGRKQVYSIELKDLKSIPLTPIQEVLQEALVLDESKPYSVRRKK